MDEHTQKKRTQQLLMLVEILLRVFSFFSATSALPIASAVAGSIVQSTAPKAAELIYSHGHNIVFIILAQMAAYLCKLYIPMWNKDYLFLVPVIVMHMLIFLVTSPFNVFIEAEERIEMAQKSPLLRLIGLALGIFLILVDTTILDLLIFGIYLFPFIAAICTVSLVYGVNEKCVKTEDSRKLLLVGFFSSIAILAVLVIHHYRQPPYQLDYFSVYLIISCLIGAITMLTGDTIPFSWSIITLIGFFFIRYHQSPFLYLLPETIVLLYCFVLSPKEEGPMVHLFLSTTALFVLYGLMNKHIISFLLYPMINSGVYTVSLVLSLFIRTSEGEEEVV
jgi:hypothetical protein